jgi:hypothetical protein
MAERVNSRIGEGAGHEVEGEVEVGEREVGKEEIDELIHELDMKEDFSSESVIGFPDLTEVNKRVNCGEERAIQPSSSLRHKFRYSICEMSATFWKS